MKTFIKINIFLYLLSINLCFAQQNKTFVRANSPKVSIKDGWEGESRYWNHLVKSKTPIVYHLAKNGMERKITFYTDIDSISFMVKPESNYQFKVLLNKSDTCMVILTTKNQQYVRNGNINNIKTDILPFTLNKNRQIILKGSINNSSEMDFCFDLGARVAYVIGKGFDKPNNLLIDGVMEDESVTGLSSEKTSSANTIQLGKLNFDNIQICYIDEAGFLDNGGGLIGFNIFQGKVLEIDFDKELIMVQNELPAKKSEYAPIPFKQTTGGMYIPITINNGVQESTGWYFFDSGADNALTFDSRFAKRKRLYNTMKIMGEAGIASSENRVINAKILNVPEVTIAGYKLVNVPTLLAEESYAESEFEDGVIGIGLQARFNFIIDFPNNQMYIKPSKYFDEPFSKKDNFVMYLAMGLSLLAGILGFYFYKRNKFNRQTN
jgi:hypothetical protein